MQVPLRELNPHWVDEGDRTGVAVRFQCPCQHEHELVAFLMRPRDGKPPPPRDGELYHSVGSTFDKLSLYPTIPCGSDCLIVVHNGMAHIIYTD